MLEVTCTGFKNTHRVAMGSLGPMFPPRARTLGF